MDQTNSLIDTFKKHWKLAAIVGLFLFVVILLSQFTLVDVELTGTVDGGTLELHTDEGDTVKLREGLNVVADGEYILRASAEDALSEKPVQLNSFAVNREKIRLDAQRNIQKVVSNSLGCVAAKGDLATAEEVFTYGCENTRNILGYSFIDRPASVAVYENSLFAPKSYMGGVLGFSVGIEGAPDSIARPVYIQGGSVTLLDYSGSPLLDTTKYQILPLVDKDGNDKREFIVGDSNAGKLSLFESVSDKNPSTVSIEDAGNFYSFAAYDQFVYALAIDTDADSQDEDEDLHEFNGGVLKKYSIQDGELQSETSLDIPGSIDLYGLEAIGPDIFITKGLEGTVNIYQIENDDIAPLKHLGRVDDVVAYKDGFAYRRDNNYFVYSRESEQSQLVYRLEYLTPTYLQNSSGQLVLSALVPGATNQYSFVLTGEERHDGLELILGYPEEYSFIRSVDYNDTTIFVELALVSVVSDHATGRTSYDQSELDDKLAEFKMLLQNDGFDPSKYKIIHQ